jgi:O-antigen/teichoic acid export membrane protein
MHWADNFQRLFCLLTGLALPPLLLFPGVVVHLLYASSFAPGAAFVLLFVITEVLLLLAGTYQALVVAMDRMAVHVANSLIAQIIVVMIAWWLVRPLGILGAGLAVLAAPIYLLAATLTFLWRAYGLRMSTGSIGRTTWLVVSLTSSGLLGVLTRESLGQGLAEKVGLYGIILLGFLVSLSRDERDKLRRFASRIHLR